MLYFSFGSNMLAARIHQADRAPSASYVAVASLRRYALRFHKRGEDGSGKCDAYHTGNPNDVVYGVLYQMASGDRQKLDVVEGVGKGYWVKRVFPHCSTNRRVAAFTYVAQTDFIDASLRPFSWYRDLVLEGARRNCFPEIYIKTIEIVKTIADFDLGRDAWERRALVAAGA